MVGILEGIYGTTTLLVALPFGTLADRWRRDRVLRICGVLELGALSGKQPISALGCAACAGPSNGVYLVSRLPVGPA